MRKNYIESHPIAFIMLCLCLVLFPSIKDTFAMEKTSKTLLQHRVLKQEEVKKYMGHVVIDAGHGGYDGGSVYKGHKEKDITLAITLKLKTMLEEEGVQVTLTRNSDKVSWSDDNVEDLSARSKIANDSQADAFISIHTNSYYDTDINGSEIWVNYDSDQNISLAKHIQKGLQDIGYTNDRGLKDQATSPLQLLVENKIPSILLETGFITGNKDLQVLTSTKGQEQIAQGITQGVLEYLKSLHKS